MADEPTAHVVDRWRAGDQAAAAELYRRYADRLVDLAARHLSARVAARVGPEDVVQSAYGSLLAALQAGRYPLHRPGELWALLVAITRNKARRQARRHTAGKRAVGRERRLDAGDGDRPPDLPAADPTPDQAAALADVADHLLAGFGGWQRTVVELRLQGYDVGEVAAAVGRTPPTVRRVLAAARDRLQAAAAAD